MQSFAGAIMGLMPSSGCSGEPHCSLWCFSAVPYCLLWWGDLVCRAESQESELLGSSPREQDLEQKIRPLRGRKGRPRRGSWQRAQQKHESTACQCWPSYVIWPWSIPEEIFVCQLWNFKINLYYLRTHLKAMHNTLYYWSVVTC